MIKIHAVSDASPQTSLAACRLLWVDPHNAVCMIHNPACGWATPFGNYCEHPLRDRLGKYNPGEDSEACRGSLH